MQGVGITVIHAVNLGKAAFLAIEKPKGYPFSEVMKKETEDFQCSLGKYISQYGMFWQMPVPWIDEAIKNYSQESLPQYIIVFCESKSNTNVLDVVYQPITCLQFVLLDSKKMFLLVIVFYVALVLWYKPRHYCLIALLLHVLYVFATFTYRVDRFVDGELHWMPVDPMPVLGARHDVE